MKCKICNKEFKTSADLTKHIKAHNLTSKEYYDLYHKKLFEGICPICGQSTPFLKFSKGYQKHCSAKCAQIDPTTNNKFRNNNPQKDPLIREKTKQTCIKLYGTESTLSNMTVGNKGKQTLLKQYNVENIFQLPDIQKRARINSHTNESNQKRETTKLHNIRQLAKEYNCIYIQDLLRQTKSSGWYQCNIVTPLKIGSHLFIKNEDIQTVLDYDNSAYHTYSINEKKIVDSIKQLYTGKIIENSKSIITPKELDIYLPALQLAIEYNGNYFHSTLTNTPEDYHLEKSLLCREKHIRLIHIYEFENLDLQISLLLSLIQGIDKYPENDFNKNNLLLAIPNPEPIFDDGRLVVYGAGQLL